VREVEEQFKRTYVGTQRGLLWCVANTTLYFHKSTVCSGCAMKTVCRSIEKANYPKIYKLRGYE
jgi:hypothetical protein